MEAWSSSATNPLRQARIIDADGRAFSNAAPLLDLTQDLHAGVEEDLAAVESGDDDFAGNQ
jgi:hypothetical protein